MGDLMNSVHRSTADEAKDYETGPFAIPGFVENGVTHEAFSFVLRFQEPRPHRPLNADDNPIRRYRHAHLTETNGAGTFHYRLKGGIVDAIYALANEDPRSCFHVVQGLKYARTESRNEGYRDGVADIMRAAGTGRLKTRKVRGRAMTKVMVMHPQIAGYAEREATFATDLPSEPSDEPSASGTIKTLRIDLR